ncbi:Hsp70 heat shock protein [Candidatus Sulfopaludibacter sp. SbA4]|nr:Hsp70 heat shock protein [Candidatus Sulfopaludibacter sp. SbA4]
MQMLAHRMKLGIDFGTTRIVAAAADRGNYPLAGFESPDGQTREWFPPLVAIRGSERRFGWNACAVQGRREWTVLRSVKRLLKRAGPTTPVDLAGCTMTVMELATEMLSAFRQQLRQASTLSLDRGEPIEAMIGVPANAHSNQRFLTAEAFRAAGFHVLGMLNEPSAASVEFGHRERAQRKGEPRRALLVYDLGGGTFDASLVEMEDDTHTVVASAGLADLGGDDFDEILANLALETAGRSGERESLSDAESFRLLEECRERKESLNPNTRRIVVDLECVREGWGEASLAVAPYYERCRPLVERTVEVVEELLAAHPGRSIETLYVTGGGSELPPVARVLKETFGRAVRRSAYMRSATAIGLAISADASSGYVLRDRFARHFGVWREADHGRDVAFDLLFPRGLELPRRGAPPLRVVRSYRPIHNIGHFRYVEAARIGADGQPSGDLTLWDDIQFPFDPALRGSADLTLIDVSRKGAGSGCEVEEEYSCDASGIVKVTIWNRSAAYSREYTLGRWSSAAPRAAEAISVKHNWGRRHR